MSEKRHPSDVLAMSQKDIRKKISQECRSDVLKSHCLLGTLLAEAKVLNEDQYQNNGQNWNRMVGHLLAVVGIDGQPSQNSKTNDGIILTFKRGVRRIFGQWWQEKKNEGGKLDFYFKHKGVFGYEEYLDSLPRHVRMYITRLRTSSHNFPIETLRKISRSERRGSVISAPWGILEMSSIIS